VSPSRFFSSLSVKRLRTTSPADLVDLIFIFKDFHA
jgi:hypothetical protein